ncbi:hypothetical protein, partial [Shewanella oneidensis]|uniref:hypothetical protein n=1 Tax=Shewanella oneidensis TaxID=70863 RepID=UPI002E7B60E8
WEPFPHFLAPDTAPRKCSSIRISYLELVAGKPKVHYVVDLKLVAGFIVIWDNLPHLKYTIF